MEPKNIDQAIGRSVVIEAVESMTGAHSIAPEHRGRGGESPTLHVPTPAATADPELRLEVETFLYRQAALLDARRWQEWTELFTEDGIYWMPVEPAQRDWLSEPSIFAEDRLLMEIRMGRLTHPNAWSQAAMWGTNHLVSNVVVESVGDAADGAIGVYSRFQMMELRRDEVRHFGGTYRHQLVRTPQGLRIRLQRVDMMNGQAAYDYVLQAWV
ncbi:MAG: aromatic-ring-hydroxylating dioxygenase subunit beta [Burkholderiaceae bacterium]|nr:aromatic-ring-hydroxylating dioxygenase subunit beta [Burkholderiaceae bacterium]